MVNCRMYQGNMMAYQYIPYQDHQVNYVNETVFNSHIEDMNTNIIQENVIKPENCHDDKEIKLNNDGNVTANETTKDVNLIVVETVVTDDEQEEEWVKPTKCTKRRCSDTDSNLDENRYQILRNDEDNDKMSISGEITVSNNNNDINKKR